MITSSDGAFTAGSDDNAKLSTSDHDDKLSTNLVSLISHMFYTYLSGPDCKDIIYMLVFHWMSGGC